MSPGPADDKLYGTPPSASEIERIGHRVLAELPELFRQHVRHVVIRVQDFADDATLAEMGTESRFDLLGLYHGVPVGRGSEMAPPRSDVDIIFLYRRALLDYWCETGEPLEDIVRNTLIHEIGHHFGFSDEDMDEIEFGGR